MSMGNFIPVAVQRGTVMAASTPPDRTTDDEDDSPEPAVGLSHPTVVPTNFESVEGDGEGGESAGDE